MGLPSFREVGVLKADNGVVAVITSRSRDGRLELTFSLQRAFDRNGSAERTTWLNRRHIETARQLLEKLPAFLDDLEDKLRAAAREERASEAK
jgi:hypothetical protein